jgi:hypothetical protein
MSVKLIRILHISLLVLIVTSGWLFSGSEGLLLNGEKNYYVTELILGGSDDNITIEISVMLFCPVIIISLLSLFEPMKLIEYLFNDMICLLQFFFLFAIEAGSIINTMVYDHNIALWMWIVSFVLFICLTQVFYFMGIYIRVSTSRVA